MDLFHALNNVLGRQISDQGHWEDDPKGSSLVFFHNQITHKLWFSLEELLRVSTEELIKQKLRERILDAIRRFPMQPLKPES